MIKDLIYHAAVTAVVTAATILTVRTMNGEIQWGFDMFNKEPVARDGEQLSANKPRYDNRWKKH